MVQANQNELFGQPDTTNLVTWNDKNLFSSGSQKPEIKVVPAWSSEAEATTSLFASFSGSPVILGGLFGGSAVKNPPAMQETWVGSLGWEDPLEERIATHSSILTWRILCTEEPGGLQS